MLDRNKKETRKKYRETHKELLKANDKAYRELHREEIKEKQKKRMENETEEHKEERQKKRIEYNKIYKLVYMAKHKDEIEAERTEKKQRTQYERFKLHAIMYQFTKYPRNPMLAVNELRTLKQNENVVRFIEQLTFEEYKEKYMNMLSIDLTIV
jgi:hypothetical protein